MQFSEGTDVDVEQNVVEMGDIKELPDDDPVQCGSEFGMQHSASGLCSQA